MKTGGSEVVLTEMVSKNSIENSVAQFVTNSSIKATRGSNIEAEFGPVLVEDDSFTEKMKIQLEAIQHRFWNYSAVENSADYDNGNAEVNEHANIGLTIVLYLTIAGRRNNVVVGTLILECS